MEGFHARVEEPLLSLGTGGVVLGGRGVDVGRLGAGGVGLLGVRVCGARPLCPGRSGLRGVRRIRHGDS